MSTKKTGVWSIALPLSVVFLAAVYYVKMPEVRKAVDARTPLVRSLLGRFVKEETPVKIIVLPGEQDPVFAKDKPPQEPAPVETPPPPTPEPVVVETPEPVAPPVEPSPEPVAAAPDWQKIANDRTMWPKKVKLTKAAKFPAVLNGKIVGSIVAPAGAEANLVAMKDDKVGLEYKGGGAWCPAVETDLIARVQAPR